jgi:hypothetical protein
MDAEDQGVVLRHGDGPKDCDKYGAREAIVFPVGNMYYMHYDGAVAYPHFMYQPE